MDFVLYVSPGACSRVPMIVLEELGIDFEEKLIRFTRGEHKQPSYLAVNPKAKIPALLVDGEALTENVAIIQYLDRLFPKAKVLPAVKDILEKSRHIADLAFCSATLHPIVTRIRMPAFTAGPDHSYIVRASAIEAMQPMAQLVSERLANGRWWYGDNYSAMDAYLLWIWFRITGAGFSASDYPDWEKHEVRMLARPAVQRALAREAAQQEMLNKEGSAFKLE